MPHLTRLRFVNIGYPKARMDDMTLELCDVDRKAIDSTLWLRNGGGKSSILSLFFSLLHPNRRSFLGAKPDQGERILEDYVLPDDRAVVIAEWKLDGEDQWYITGGFYEWHQGETRYLKRLFFATKVLEPEMTLENIPLKDANGQRFTMYTFKQAWQNLGKKYPHADIHETDNQYEWRKILEGMRIDPELFAYQIRMNNREGGADELFRFKESDQFIDFFLELVMRPELGGGISKNLDTYRSALRERKQYLLPSLELIQTLKKKLQPMLEVAVQRNANRMQIGELHIKMNQLSTHLIQQSEVLDKDIVQVTLLENETQRVIEQSQQEAQVQFERSLAFERLVLGRRLERLKTVTGQLEQSLQAASHARLVWKAFVPLVDVERDEERIKQLEALLAAQDSSLKPDWEQVHTAAKLLSAALIAHSNELKIASETKSKAALEQRNQGIVNRQQAGLARRDVGSADERAKQLQNQLEHSRAAYRDLQKHGHLEFEEPIGTALERWKVALANSEFQREMLQGEQIDLQQRRDTHVTEFEMVTRELIEAQHREKQTRVALVDARTVRSALESNPVLVRVLGIEQVEQQMLNTHTVNILRQCRAEVEQNLRELMASFADHESILAHLKSRGLLPPTRDIETVRRTLQQKGVIAWAGWEFVAENYSVSEARGIATEYPELIQGVVVRDAHFEKSRATLDNIQLNIPVVVVAQTDAFTKKIEVTQRFVVGPTSDAHFDRDAAKREEIELEVRLERERFERAEIESEIKQLRDTTDQLERFMSQYPNAWFTESETALYVAETDIRDYQERQLMLETQKNAEAQRLKEIEVQKQQKSSEIRIIEHHLQYIEGHLKQYGDEKTIFNLENQIADMKIQSQNLIIKAEQCDIAALNIENQSHELENEAIRLSASSAREIQEARNVNYLKGEIPDSIPGNIELLREAHKQLVDLIEEKTNNNEFQKQLDQTRDSLQAHNARFKREMSEKISEFEVRALLQTLLDKNSVSEQLEIRTQIELALKGEFSVASSNLINAEHALNSHQTQHSKINTQLLKIETLDWDELKLEQAAIEAKQVSEKETQNAERLNDQKTSYRNQKSRLEARQQQIQNYHEQIKIILEQNEDIFKEILENPNVLTGVSPSDENLKSYITDLDKTLKSEKSRRHKLLIERDQINQEFRTCLGTHTFDFVKPLLQWDAQNLETDIQQLLTDLETRAQNIQAALEESEQHRNTLITETLTAAERGVQMLRSLMNHSKLPEAAGTLADQKFLKISYTVISTPSEQRERIGTLIDDVVTDMTREIPKGIEIVQRAVRKLAHPIRVEVLFPDIDAPPHYIAITAMSKESGGERLTSAVLLYCALAQQRAQERGRNVRLSSSLLLDNPIGASSRVKFLELQRETAKAMNIQLIYATGVNDFEAIRTMPNIVRLRNEKRSARGDHQLLEVTRLLRPDEGASGVAGVN
jgi:hypothetical protein